MILRPGMLTNNPGTGHVRLGMAIPYSEVPRDDVAAVLSELVHCPQVRRVILELTSICGGRDKKAAAPRAPEGFESIRGSSAHQH